MRGAYYNENEGFAAEWLRNLISRGFIAPGEVDSRDIRNVAPEDLRGFTQCHFFAGIGVWSHALRQAGWDDDRPVWTGSCPCQPFSAPGKRRGADDERHLWPVWFDLIRKHRPIAIFGEQVAGKAGYGWWDSVSADLESEAYASAAADLAAASVGAPHIRQRLYWMARPAGEGSQRRTGRDAHAQLATAERDGEACRLADDKGERRATRGRPISGGSSSQQPDRQRDAVRMGHAQNHDGGLPDRRDGGEIPESGRPGEDGRADALAGFWRDADWLGCTDGRWRPVEAGTFPLVNGATGRVGKLRAYGNAICAPLAVEFIRAAAGAISD